MADPMRKKLRWCGPDLLDESTAPRCYAIYSEGAIRWVRNTARQFRGATAFLRSCQSNPELGHLFLCERTKKAARLGQGAARLVVVGKRVADADGGRFIILFTLEVRVCVRCLSALSVYLNLRYVLNHA
jgi:hypothetical protein